MRLRHFVCVGASLALAACGASSSLPPPGPLGTRTNAPTLVIGEQRLGEPVMGRTAQALVSLFGPPALDAQEGPARKLQFLGPHCVLDAYLYPQHGRGEPVVTHVDTRLPDGRDTDRNACIAALGRR